MQIGQTTLSNATYQDLIQSRITQEEKINLNSHEFKTGQTPFINSSKNEQDWRQFYEAFKSQITDEELVHLHHAIQKINEELSRLRDEIQK